MKPLMLSALFFAVFILLQKGSTAMLPRGIRNNNPGNLKDFGIDWKGLVPDSKQFDPVMCVFTAPHWGIRAMGRDLTTDYNRDGQRTIAALLTEYAPGSENNTAAYIKSVSDYTGISPTAVLDLASDLPVLVAAIIKHENGQQPYSMAYIVESLAVA